MKLNDDVYVLTLPMSMRGNVSQINLSLILDANHGPTLVDAGLPGQIDAIAAGLAEAGVRIQDLKRIIITHQDLDHVGSLHDLVQASGARVLAHEVEAPYIDGTLRPIKFPSPDAPAPIPEMQAALEKWRPTPVDELLHDDTHLDLAGGVRVIFTPGHTPGHISLYLERTKTLISGDALVAQNGQLSGPMARATPNMPQAQQSVQKLSTLDDVQTIVCYHASVVNEDASTQLQRVAQEAALAAS